MQVFYNDKFEVDISHISVFNKICKNNNNNNNNNIFACIYCTFELFI